MYALMQANGSFETRRLYTVIRNYLHNMISFNKKKRKKIKTFLFIRKWTLLIYFFFCFCFCFCSCINWFLFYDFDVKQENLKRKKKIHFCVRVFQRSIDREENYSNVYWFDNYTAIASVVFRHIFLHCTLSRGSEVIWGCRIHRLHLCKGVTLPQRVFCLWH